MTTVREIPSKVARSMTFKNLLPEVAQFPNEANLLMVDDDKFHPAARSAALFPPGDNEIAASRGAKVSEKPDAETGSRGAGISRHHLAETAMRGPAEHISPLFAVPRAIFTRT